MSKGLSGRPNYSTAIFRLPGGFQSNIEMLCFENALILVPGNQRKHLLNQPETKKVFRIFLF
jgi:hypothetical protein